MTGRRHPFAAVGLALVAFLALMPSSYGAGKPEDDFKADETIRTLVVRVEVGAGGGDLAEPLTLDLGLGFPFLLHPIGRAADESPSFGAVPQETTAKTTVAAGTGVTFTFSATDNGGADVLKVTPRLLAGVRVSDIARVGFASAGVKDWELAGYSVTINDKPFAASSAVARKVREAQDAAREALAKLAEKVGPLLTERDDLRSIADAGLGTDADAARLKEIDKELPPLLAERQRLEGQVQGKYPWYEDRDFVSPWRGKDAVGSARVTLLTYTHPEADTQNYVYFCAGGHKFLVGSPENPLGGEAPREVTLDLIAGPLTPADLRGWALGTLGHSGRQGAEPDRWHPQRLLVELDGSVVYDSEESAADRRSLEVIRLIPPAHLDAEGKVVANTATARELFLWEAGKGAGLEEYPVEKGPPADLAGEEEVIDEEVIGEEVIDGQEGDGSAAEDVPAGSEDAGADPLPWGEPFQVEGVRITSGWKANHWFTVEWQVSGNEAEISHYVIALVGVFPHNPNPWGPPLFSGVAPAGSRSMMAHLPPGASPPFLAPVVVAMPAGAGTQHLRVGPARTLFPAGPVPAQPLLLALFGHGPPATLKPVSYGGQPPWFGRAVWADGPVASHRGILFAAAVPGWNVGVRPGVADNYVNVFWMSPTTLTGNYNLYMHLAFQGGAGAANHVKVASTCSFFKNNVFLGATTVEQELGTAPWLGAPMPVLHLPVNPPGGATDYVVVIRCRFTEVGADILHPPGLVGFRLVP